MAPHDDLDHLRKHVVVPLVESREDKLRRRVATSGNRGEVVDVHAVRHHRHLPAAHQLFGERLQRLAHDDDVGEETQVAS